MLAQEDAGVVLESILEDRAFQKDLPLAVPTVADNQDRPAERQPRTSPAPSSPAPIERTPQENSANLNLGPLGWVMIAFMVGVMIIALYKSSTEALRKNEPQEKKASRISHASKPLVDKPTGMSLVSIDRLADSAEYGLALRELLTLSLDLVKPQFSWSIYASLTNREVLNDAKLTTEAKQALSHIVLAEERSQYAHKAVSQEVFKACRDSYLVLLRIDQTNRDRYRPSHALTTHTQSLTGANDAS